MKLSLFDLHCDTPYEMYRQKQPLASNSLAISLEHARGYKKYIQVMALWTDHRLNDEAGWQQCFSMLENLRHDPVFLQKQAFFTTHITASPPAPSILLGVEDARILAGDLDRVDRLFSEGVRILTPLWKGVTCIGGSHDTDSGLTAFGMCAIRRAIALGMIPDISHASERSADEILELAAEQSRPVIASHSNAYSVCPVSRNLRDRQIRAILQANGVIGLNLYPVFLIDQPKAFAKDLLPHLEHFLEMGAENALCLGGDMDGADLPSDIPNLGALIVLAELMLARNYSQDLIDRIFFQNAFHFFQTYLP